MHVKHVGNVLQVWSYLCTISGGENSLQPHFTDKATEAEVGEFLPSTGKF